MKKNLMLAIVTVMTATVLAGCGTDTASNATNNEPVVEQAAVATDDENIVEDIVEDAVVADEEPAEEPAEVKEEKSGRTLEQYFEENNLKGVFDQEIQATKDSSQNAYKDIEWAIDGNIISYIYTYVTDTAIDDQTKAYFDQTFQTTTNGILPGMIKESGIEDIGIRYVFNNPDGTAIYDETFYCE